MAPRPYHLAGQVRLGDKATITFLHPYTFYLPAQNIIFFLNGVAILLYCYYSLVGYLSIKPRGLVQDAM
jgi:hypothetical protein